MKKNTSIQSFTTHEYKLYQQLHTVAKVQTYLNDMPYNWEQKGETLRSFRRVAREHYAHCLEAVFFAAAILSEYGYPPLVLDLSSKDNLDHCLFLYEHDGRFGSIGLSREPELYGKPALFPSIHKLVMSYYDDYIDETACLDGYAVVNLDDIPYANWRFSERNIWAVEDYLIEKRHHRLDYLSSRVTRIRRQQKESQAASVQSV